MPHTIIAFAEANTPDGTLQAITPVADQSIRTAGNFIFIKHMKFLMGANMFAGALPLRAYVMSPSLRVLNYFEITPVEAALIVTEAIDYRIQPTSPLELPVADAVSLYMSATAGAARNAIGCIWLSDGKIEPVDGEIFHAYATGAITEVAIVWTAGELTFDQPLPVGKYAIVGARCQTADDGTLFRLVSVDGVNRPGGLCVNGEECPDLREQRNGGLGVWMEFDHDSPPELEVLSSVGGDAVQNVTLDLIKIS